MDFSCFYPPLPFFFSPQPVTPPPTPPDQNTSFSAAALGTLGATAGGETRETRRHQKPTRMDPLDLNTDAPEVAAAIAFRDALRAQATSAE